MSTNLSLYTLSTELQAIAAQMADEGFDEATIADTVESLAMPFEEKAKAVASVARNFDALAEQIKAAESQMADRRRRLERRAERLRAYLLESMQAAGITKIESPWFALAVKKRAPSLDLFDPAQVPAEYLREPVPPAPTLDRVSILQDLKLGKEVPGARIEYGYRLEVK